MHSLSKYSRANQINKSWIEEYLNEAHSQGLISVRCHCNIMAWSDDRDELKHIKNDVGSQLALMECKPRHNTTDTRPCFGREYPAIRRTSRRKKVSTHLSNRLFACSPKKRTTKVRFHPLVSRWWIGSRESRCTSTYQPAHEKRYHYQSQQVHTWAEW